MKNKNFKYLAQAILGILILTISLPIIPIARAQTTPTPINCGQIIDENLPLTTGQTPTAQDIATANCMSNALYTCQPATSTIYSTDSKQTVTTRIDSGDSQQCTIYIESYSKTETPKLCAVPLDFINYGKNLVLTDPKAQAQAPFAYYYVMIAALLQGYTSGSGGTSTYGNPPQTLNITCKDASATITPAPTPAPAPTGGQSDLSGDNVLIGNTVYLLDQVGSRNAYPSAGSFLSYKFNTWGSVIPASNFDTSLPVDPTLIPPRDGALINDKGTVYIISNGKRSGFISAAVFTGLGYSFGNVYPGDTSFMTTLPPIDSVTIKHPDGTLITDSNTLYVMHNGNRSVFPSLDVFNTWGYWSSEAVPANSYDQQASVDGTIELRHAGELNIVLNPDLTTAAQRDVQRLTDVQKLESAIELYFSDKGAYPIILADLTPVYIGFVPIASAPADGSCSDVQNSFSYTQISNNNYSLSFCLGSASGNFSAGPHVLSPSGIR